MYAWIAENKGKESIAYCCRVLSVSRTGYHRHHGKEDKKGGDATILSELFRIHQEHPEYGTERVRRSLTPENRCSYGKVYRLRKENGWVRKTCRRPQGVTKRNDEDQLSEDLIQRDFSAVAPNRKWLGDITQVSCKDGKLYVGAVFDCFDGAIVGLSMREDMTAELCVQALESAVMRYGKSPGLIFHSDRGSQYTSHRYRKALALHGIEQSMGRTGSCYDNARMESFFATLKKEALYVLPLSTLTKEQVRRIIFRFIECGYNRTRLYSANPEYMPPLVYRAWSAARKQNRSAA